MAAAAEVPPGSSVLLCGGEGLREELERVGCSVSPVHEVPGTRDRYDAVVVGLHREFDYAFENPWQASGQAEFSCEVHRGKGHGLFVLNHFVSDPLPDREAAMAVNRAPSLAAHVRRCARERGQWPNFVTVDHYDVGDLFAVVRSMNRQAQVVNR